MLTFTTLAAAPAAIADLHVLSNNPHELVLAWTPGLANGDAIVGYSVHAVSVDGEAQEVTLTTEGPTAAFKGLGAAATYAVFVVVRSPI